MKVARRLTVLVVTLALSALCSLELAYRLTIASIAPPPGLETGAPLSPRLACAVWAAETGGGPRPIPRLYPWTVHRYVADHDLAFVPAWGVARTWLATAQERGQVRGMMQWHFKGIAATAWVTRNLPQEEIMRRYADKLWAGGPEVGLEAGARYWYQAAATSLDDAQLALLLAVAASPSHYDPLAHPERALERRNVVLTRFFQAGCIPGSSLAAAQAAPLGLAPPRREMGAAEQGLAAVEGAWCQGILSCRLGWAEELVKVGPSQLKPGVRPTHFQGRGDHHARPYV